MAVIESISGIRGIFGEGLDPELLVGYAAAFGEWLRSRRSDAQRPTVVLGRDARVTGDLCARVVGASLQAVGCDVVYAGLATTPTVQMGVLDLAADGGIEVSASHNDAEWNALKLFNEKGEYLTQEEGTEVGHFFKGGARDWQRYDAIGEISHTDFLDDHIKSVLALPIINPARIRKANLRVAVDAVNSVGGIAVPALLEALGIKKENIVLLYCDPTGLFAHTAEPLPVNLGEIVDVVARTGVDIGFAVDPDVDRLALIADGGVFIGEELTQVVAADFLFQSRPGSFVTNLSSSRLIEDIAGRYGQVVFRSAVGEINVVTKMKEVGAILGGEGNGGVIYPAVHYGRDALVGIALVLQYLADSGKPLSEIIADYPRYSMSKQKVSLEGIDAESVLEVVAGRYAGERISTIDGVKIDFTEGWVHLRKSNTEPIIRVYTESRTPEEAEKLAERFLDELSKIGK